MTDIVKEARELLTYWIDILGWPPDSPAPAKVSALADECERMRDEAESNADFRVSINEALPRPFGVTVLGAINELKAEIAQLRADLAALNRALADERAAVAIAHERIAEVTAELDEAIEDRRQARDDAARAAALLAVRTMELDNARSRVVEQIKKSLPHAMQNAKAVYKYDVNESRARAMAVLIVDEAIQCLHFDDTRESIRAHAAGSGKGGDDA